MHFPVTPKSRESPLLAHFFLGNYHSLLCQLPNISHLPHSHVFSWAPFPWTSDVFRGMWRKGSIAAAFCTGQISGQETSSTFCFLVWLPLLWTHRQGYWVESRRGVKDVTLCRHVFHPAHLNSVALAHRIFPLSWAVAAWHTKETMLSSYPWQPSQISLCPSLCYFLLSFWK